MNETPLLYDCFKLFCQEWNSELEMVPSLEMALKLGVGAPC